ncbi:MAG TPA: hypothetical protein VGV39_11455 [Mesorhizobium sp.]|uniref:hypothetical protein n=1 Tax=Mesorhizobium sp. TaxID=1871066 RepID=UPI002DDCC67C|nr:hypothetical protein [Mesorhizobium sp.]HEV2503687.1 hypothetical protein [Mesorhizobium sp.]
MVDLSAEARQGASCILPIQTGMEFRAAGTSTVSGGFIPAFVQGGMHAGSALDAFAIENSVVNGGSLTPQEAKSAKSTRFVYGIYIRNKQ